MKSYFFNAEPTTDLVSHPTGYDREYDADDHAAFFEPFFTKAGVFAGAHADACKVSVEGGNVLRFAPGALYVRGRMAALDGTETLTITADCKVVARMNKTADVRSFQLLAVEALVQEEDIYDLLLAEAAVTPVLGGYEAVVTDKRTFMAFTGQPPYYPPESEALPYVLWLYALGFPLTAEQRAAVEGNPSLMDIFHRSTGAIRSTTITFAAADWTALANGEAQMTISKERHQRQTANFTTTLWSLVNGVYHRSTWAAMCTDVVYHTDTGSITLTAGSAYDGKVTFMG